MQVIEYFVCVYCLVYFFRFVWSFLFGSEYIPFEQFIAGYSRVVGKPEAGNFAIFQRKIRNLKQELNKLESWKLGAEAKWLLASNRLFLFLILDFFFRSNFHIYKEVGSQKPINEWKVSSWKLIIKLKPEVEANFFGFYSPGLKLRLRKDLILKKKMHFKVLHLLQKSLKNSNALIRLVILGFSAKLMTMHGNWDSKLQHVYEKKPISHNLWYFFIFSLFLKILSWGV